MPLEALTTTTSIFKSFIKVKILDEREEKNEKNGTFRAVVKP